MNAAKALMIAAGLILIAALAAAAASGIPSIRHYFFSDTANQQSNQGPSGSGPAGSATSLVVSTNPPAVLDLAAAFGFSDPKEVEAAQQLRVLFTTGAYSKSLALAELALAKPDISAAFRAWLTAQMPVILASEGWAAIATGNCDRAIESLRRAALLATAAELPGPMNADIRRGLGFCLKKTGQPGGAEENFLEALKSNPQDQESRLLLADLYESDGRFSEAVHTLEEAQPSPDITKRLEVMRRRAGEGDLQQIQRTPHFNISYRTGEHEALAAQAAQILESSLDEFTDRYGYKAPLIPIEVVLYPTERFSWVLGGVPDWAEGIFDGRMRIPVRSGGSQEIIAPVLRHELVHALNANMTGGRALPPWLEEGLAQRIGEMPRGGSFPFPIKPPPFAPAADFGASYMSFGSAAAGSIYRQSLYLVMALETIESDALRRVISALSSEAGTSPDAVLAPIGGNFARLYDTSSRWWLRRRPLSVR